MLWSDIKQQDKSENCYTIRVCIRQGVSTSFTEYSKAWLKYAKNKQTE